MTRTRERRTPLIATATRRNREARLTADFERENGLQESKPKDNPETRERERERRERERERDETTKCNNSRRATKTTTSRRPSQESTKKNHLMSPTI
jgi:hypothetical protein